MRGLSKGERFVLTKLEENCRFPASKIAKEGRLSPEGVIKIIKRLENKNIIIGYKTKINYSKLGIVIYRVYIKLKSKNKKVIEQIKKIIEKHKCCPWYSFCEGEYDLRLSIETNSMEFTKDIDQLFFDLNKHIKEKQIMLFLYAFSLSKSFIESHRKLFTVIEYKEKIIELSNNESEIINLLRMDPTIRLINISKKLQLSQKTVGQLIKNLTKKNIITGFKSKLNMANLGYLPYVALFQLGVYKQEDITRFQSYCKEKEEINYFIQGIGIYDIEVVMYAKTINSFYKMINEIREKFPFISKISTLIESY